jgi:cysteine-rich repeat protein
MKTLPFLLLSLAACAPKIEVTLLSIAGENDPVLSRIDFVVRAGDRIATVSDQKIQFPRIETLVLPDSFEDELLNIEAVVFIGDKEVGRSATNVVSGQTEATLLFAICSNGTVEDPELCDDGNLTDGDGCDSTCKPTGCNSDVFTPGEVCFSTQNPVVANAAPSDVQIEDMNGDNLLDLVAIYPTQGTVRIFFGNENNLIGDFDEIAMDALIGLTGTGDDLRQISVLDVDGDQVLDFATSAKVGGAVFAGVLLNKGDASFSAGSFLFAGNDIRDVGLADLDGDQLPELIALDFPSNTLRTFKSIGSGDFETSFVSVPVGAQPVALSTVDIDQDGDLDVITINASGSFSVLLNSAGILSEEKRALTNGTPIALTTADFDGDGLLDIAVTKQAGGDFISLFTQIATQPIDFQPGGNFAAPNNPRGLIAADVDLDGDTDIAVTSESTSNVTILVNDGVAQFAAAEPTIGTTPNPKKITAGDINRDGLVDFVTAGQDLGIIFSTP